MAHKVKSEAKGDGAVESYLGEQRDDSRGVESLAELHARRDDSNHRASLQDSTVQALLEQARAENLPQAVKDRLEADLRTNKTADYSRINLSEVFMAFDFDVNNTITHWRVAKIMDAMTICADEFGILTTGLNKGRIEADIYDVLEQGRGDAKEIEARVINPKTQKEEYHLVSLADIAHFIDTMKINRELGTERFDKKVLAFNFFTGGELKKNIPVEGGGEVVIDLRNKSANPRDDYQTIDIKGYKKCIEKAQTGLTLMGSWRFDSPGHREIAGHSFLVKVEGKIMWLPMSGEIAQNITMEDMQKTNEPKAGLGGQPQEIGDMEESKTGAIVRFRAKMLRQRRVGVTPSQMAGSTSRRLAKAMLGFTLKDDPKVVREGGHDQKVTITLGTTESNGAALKGIKLHYDKARGDIGLPPLTEGEAADLLFTDVFAPCILNNEKDWLLAIQKTFSVSQVNTIANQTNVPWKDFVLKIQCRDISKEGVRGDIILKTFTSANELLDYAYLRAEVGDIEQDGNVDLSEQRKRKAAEAERKRAAIEHFDATSAKQYTETINFLLGKDYESYLSDFISGDKEKFLEIRDKKGKRIPAGTDSPGRKEVSFIDILNKEIEWNKDRDGLIRLLKEIFPWMPETPDNDDDDTFEAVVSDFLDVLDGLTPADKQKLKV